MATLASLVVRISGSTVELNKAIDKAQTRTDRFRKGAGKAFTAVGKAAAGLGVAGVGALAAFGGSLVKNLIDTEKELRPMVERSRIAAESLQVLSEAATRAGSEDGLEAIVDSAQELQLQLGELALTGNARAVPALEKLGLSAAKLQEMSPEAAFRAVVTELQKIPNVADRAIAAEEVFGGTSEKLAGIVNLTAAEFASLESQVRATTDVWSQEALDNAKAFDEGLKGLMAVVTSLASGFVADLLPKVTEFAAFLASKKPEIEAFIEDVRVKVKPFFDAFVTGVKTVLPVLKGLAQFIFRNKPLLIAAIVAVGAAIVFALGPVSGTVAAIVGIVTVIGFLKNNWESIWGAIVDFFEGIVDKIVGFFDSGFAWLIPGGPLIKALLFIARNWEQIWTTVRDLWDKVSGAIKGAYESNLGWLLPAGPLIKAIIFVKDEWDRIWGLVRDTWDTVSNAIKTAYETVLGPIFGETGVIVRAIKFIRREWDRVWGIVQTAWETFVQVIQRVYDNTLGKLFGEDGIIAKALRALQTAWDSVWGAIKNGFDRFVRPIVRLINDILSPLRSVFSLFDKISRFQLPDLPSIPSIPGFQAGGITPGGAALVGERGPEIAQFPRGTRIIPNSQIGSARGGGGGNTFNVAFYGVQDPREMERKFRRLVTRLQIERVLPGG